MWLQAQSYLQDKYTSDQNIRVTSWHNAESNQLWECHHARVTTEETEEKRD